MFQSLEKLKIALLTFCVLMLCTCATSVFADFFEPETDTAVRDVTTKIDQNAKTENVAVDKQITVTTTTTVTPGTPLPVCTHCGVKIPVGNNYIQMRDGRNFCSQQCYYESLPRCSICARAFENGFKKDNYYFCSVACLEQTYPQCQCCRKPSKMWKILGTTDEVYCPTCMALPKCFSCTRPTLAATRISGDRILCEQCRKTAIGTNQEAQPHVVRVRTILRDQLGLNIDSSDSQIALSMVSPATFRKKLPTANLADEPGAVIKTTVTDPKTGVTRDHYEIIICRDLSTPRFIEVLAHEFAVVWLKQNYPFVDNQAGGKALGNPQLREGFGEWVGSRVNEIEGRPAMNIRMNNNPSQYWGDGYRMVKGRIDQLGFEAFKKELERLNSTQR